MNFSDNPHISLLIPSESPGCAALILKPVTHQQQQIPGLFLQQLTGATHLCRKVPQLGQAVLDPQYRFLIIHMNSGLMGKCWNGRSVYIGEFEARVLTEKMAATRLTPFSITLWCLAVAAYIVSALSDFNGARVPQTECIDRPCRPVAA